MKLAQSVKFLKRDENNAMAVVAIVALIHVLADIFFGTLIGDSYRNANTDFSMEGVVILFLFIAALVTHAEGLQFLSQNGVTRKTYAAAALVDGVITVVKFTLFAALLSVLMQTVMGLLGSNSSFLFFGNRFSLNDLSNMSNLPMAIVIGLLIGLLAYFFGHMLTSINYYLGTKGKLIFWISLAVFVIMMFAAFGMGAESMMDGGMTMTTVRGFFIYPLVNFAFNTIRYFIANPNMLYVLGIILVVLFAFIAYLFNRKIQVRATSK